MGFTSCRNIQILLGVLKGHGIKKFVVSPGTTNLMLVGSIQDDLWFEVYSAPDERSAAYMACGMAAESGEAVCLSCTGATASRNYYPGMTEAYYRKLPVLAITSLLDEAMPGNNTPQVLDRTVLANDVAVYNVSLPAVHTDADAWKCNLKANTAVLELFHNGGGPVHIQLPAIFSADFSLDKLPATRIIKRFSLGDELPKIPTGKRVAVFVGEHREWDSDLTEAVDAFCGKFNAVVLCDQTSNYHGKYRVLEPVIGCQEMLDRSQWSFDIMIDIGGVTGNYYHLYAAETWRVSPDGRLSDRFRNLHYVFEMQESAFFKQYGNAKVSDGIVSPRKRFDEAIQDVLNHIPELPFSHIWIAQNYADKLPQDSRLFLGILHSLRSWNFFTIPDRIICYSNVGGFGIDGGTSTFLGGSLVHKDKIYFLMTGDLAFFYDLNVLGNRHLGSNCRIMLVNNGRGTEFRNYSHPAQQIFADKADVFMAAAGHYGDKSPCLIRHFAEDLGFKYLSASTKEEFCKIADEFFTSEVMDQPILLEVFTDPRAESESLKMICSAVQGSAKVKIKKALSSHLSEKNKRIIKKIIRRN